MRFPWAWVASGGTSAQDPAFVAGGRADLRERRGRSSDGRSVQRRTARWAFRHQQRRGKWVKGQRTGAAGVGNVETGEKPGGQCGFCAGHRQRNVRWLADQAPAQAQCPTAQQGCGHVVVAGRRRSGVLRRRADMRNGAGAPGRDSGRSISSQRLGLARRDPLGQGFRFVAASVGLSGSVTARQGDQNTVRRCERIHSLDPAMFSDLPARKPRPAWQKPLVPGACSSGGAWNLAVTNLPMKGRFELRCASSRSRLETRLVLPLNVRTVSRSRRCFSNRRQVGALDV